MPAINRRYKLYKLSAYWFGALVRGTLIRTEELFGMRRIRQLMGLTPREWSAKRVGQRHPVTLQLTKMNSLTLISTWQKSAHARGSSPLPP